ncbi:MAG: TetR/AcrR family transcriptional regulator [Hyphomicrobiales bacterium]|nr:TetR/AcrR family transcriptional regulator [Hyphomicrobiales bacterium]
MVAQTALSLASRGLQRTSFSEIIQASGAPRGSLYHHFPGGKDELVLAALDAAGAWAMQQVEAAPAASPLDVAKAFIDLWRGVLARSDFAAGCAIAAVTVAAETPDIIMRAAAIFSNWRARLAAQFARQGMGEDHAAGLATLLIAACEGAVLLARAERSMAPFERTADMLLAIVVSITPLR